MEKRQEIKEAVILGLLVELSLRKRYQRYKRNRSRKKLRSDILNRLRNKKRRPHRLPPGWRDIAVDGWDGMVM